MYFTKTRELNKYEKMMKRTPDIGSKRSEEDMPSCTKCLNKDLPIIRCRNCRCRNIAARAWNTGRTTKEWLERGLTQITYVPFAERLKSVLASFSGNRRYFHNWHELAFKSAVNHYSLRDDQVGKLAGVYVLSIQPELMQKVYVLSDRIIPFNAKLTFKEKKTLEFANQLLDPKAKLQLGWVSNDLMFSEAEFICLCNAILIRDYGMAVIRERLEPSRQYIRIPC